MATTVLIRGGGVAASCCESLLSRAGFRTLAEKSERPHVPAIMLGQAAQKLLQDVFQKDDLFRGLPGIRQRVVSWGLRAEPRAIPHSAVVVSERELLDRLQVEPVPGDRQTGGEEAMWTILTSRPLPATAVEHHFGSRMATASAVRLEAGCDTETCWVESIEQGWLFLLPGAGEAGWLLSVGGRPDLLLAGSRVVAEQISEMSGSSAEFSSHPRIADPLCDAGWLACGAAALGFDPLCGDGVGNAAREAILGSAVVRAVAEGADVNAVTEHYRARLLAGFARHLQACREFYEAGCRGPWWNQELESTRRGLEWCARQLENAPEFRYRLSGFALEAVK